MRMRSPERASQSAHCFSCSDALTLPISDWLVHSEGGASCDWEAILSHFSPFKTIPVTCLGYSIVFGVVSASDVTPTDRWLNVWCIRLTYLETLQECRSFHRIGWTGFPGDVCVAFFNATHTKPPHERRKPSCLQMWRQMLIRIK